MPSYEDLQRDYWAPDREAVLADAQRMEQQPQPQGPQIPQWDRSAFRDQWMGSGIQNVPAMHEWLRNTGWGQHVGVGGSKGDLMYLPSGETMDTVLAAGLGGNRGGPQWTGRGNWMQEGRVPYGGMGPSQPPVAMYQGGWGMPGGFAGGTSRGGWGQMPPGGQGTLQGQNPAQQQTQMHRGFGRHQMMQQRQQQNPYGQQGQRLRPLGGMQSQSQPMMRQPNYQQNRGMYY